VTKLIKYEQARHALAVCKQVDEVKDWADKAAAMQAYGRMAQGVYRHDVVGPVLRDWYERTMHETNIVQRVLRGKGTAGADPGRGGE
jgi:hypothetical protein